MRTKSLQDFCKKQYFFSGLLPSLRSCRDALRMKLSSAPTQGELRLKGAHEHYRGTRNHNPSNGSSCQHLPDKESFTSMGDLARQDSTGHGGYVCVVVWEQELVHVGGRKSTVDSGEPRGVAVERKTIVREKSMGLIIHYGRTPRS